MEHSLSSLLFLSPSRLKLRSRGRHIPGISFVCSYKESSLKHWKFIIITHGERSFPPPQLMLCRAIVDGYSNIYYALFNIISVQLYIRINYGETVQHWILIICINYNNFRIRTPRTRISNGEGVSINLKHTE